MNEKNIEYLQKIIAILEESNLETLEYSDKEVSIALQKSQGNVVYEQAVAVKESVAEVVEAQNEVVSTHKHEITSPIIGTFYSSPGPDKPAYVKVGDRVKKGQVVCIVEAMKLMNEIESPYDGVISEIMVANEDGVEFDQVLFKID